MAVTNTPSTLEIQKWRRDFFTEWQRENLFAPYIGNGTDAVIQRIYELRDEGEQITIPIVGRLTGSGQVGANTLTGNEEQMDQYGHKIVIDWARHAVLLNKKEMRKSAIDQMGAVRPLLNDWAAAKLRDDFVRAFGTIQPFGTASSLSGNVQGIPMISATPAQLNAWLTGNADRVQFGNGQATLVAGNFAASLLNVDSTNDLATVAAFSRIKRIAKNADPKIRPLRVEDGREYFVTFLASGPFADLARDPAMLSANTNARAREGSGMDKNPLFQDGDLMLQGMIYREVPELSQLVLKGAGAGGVDVYPSFTCGQQAMGYAIGQLPAPTTRNDDDYGFIKGRGVETCYGISKIVKGRNAATASVAAGTNADWGVVTSFFATASAN
ncbi:hypothetical protein LNAOJCKE_0947 [Methylorubrum aminovorans]|uniref:DUF4043 family protein n=1 Tax=Methylorubrum aminovorans TaxID=269069 RepID=A0ABQ4U8L2_9HYPH|nr:DUF4043 family protein [Methylorubrum aminovorans]GJE63749.1 hypothetical protein LNAOJCKE_0947 [Methylorubrum aminovorans]GMA73587.1 hypothetical protein GCM10025880_00040 [Methylorubrum aminovorans]GMA73676.1 hypothetical protein GCM10025880_00930 [Methylorubrum aminovorans]